MKVENWVIIIHINSSGRLIEEFFDSDILTSINFSALLYFAKCLADILVSFEHRSVSLDMKFRISL